MDKKLIDGKYRYFAFIAYTRYKSKDFKYAQTIYHELQKHGLPTKLVKIHNTSKRTKPLFLDHFDMPPQNYHEADPIALKESKKLIVICSTRLVEHEKTAVIQEIKDFLDCGHTWNDIIPIIVDNVEKPEINCFPKIIKDWNEKNKDWYSKIGKSWYKPSGRKDVENVIYHLISQIHDIELSELERFERKRKIKRTVLGSALCLVLAIVFAFSIMLTRERSNIENGIVEAINISSDNTYNALTSLLDIEKRQNHFLLNNKNVYTAIEEVVNYRAGQCLRKQQFDLKNIQSINVVNSSGNLFGVKTKNRYYVIDMNDYKIKYEISTNDFWYEKQNQKYQMLLHNDEAEHHEIDKVWCDNDKVYLSFEHKNTDISEPFEVVIETDNNTSYEADVLWDEHLYEKKDDGVQILGTVIAVPDNEGNDFPLVHEADVSAYAVKSDLNVIWSMDKNGYAYTWSMEKGYSIIDKMYDSNNDYVWGITTYGLLFRMDLKNNTVTKIVKCKEVAFVGQDDNNVFVTITNEHLQRPVICMCNKKNGSLKQIKGIPEIREEQKHLMSIESNALNSKESVVVAKSIIDYIDGRVVGDDVYARNNSVEFADIADAKTFDDLQLYFSIESSYKLNPMKVTILSRQEVHNLVPRIHASDDMYLDMFYKVDEGEWRSVYSENGILHGIDISQNLEYEKEHILHLKSISRTNVTTIKSYRFILINDEIQWKVGTKDRSFTSDSIAEIKTPNIVIDCKENVYNPVEEITYAFDNDPEVYSVQGRIADVKIPEKYLDGKEHKILMYFVSKNVRTKYYVYSFKYKK